jgi:multisubunit Na+/H+ antiporter MnhB subunit
MMEVLLLAHDGHQHGPDLGFVALLVVGAVLVVLLLAGMVRGRVARKAADQRPSGRPPRG